MVIFLKGGFLLLSGL